MYPVTTPITGEVNRIWRDGIGAAKVARHIYARLNLCYSGKSMEEERVHFYNVITGKCACGAAANPKEVAFSVFLDHVSCPECLKTMRDKEGKSEGKSG